MAQLILSTTEDCSTCILCGSERIADYDTITSLKRCSSCGHIFDSPRPTQAAIAAFYSKAGKYSVWESTLPRLEKQWWRVLRRLRRFQPGGRLLDVGAGIGQFLSVARAYYSITGTEISAEACRIAHRRYDIDLTLGEFESFEFTPASFDIVSMFQVLEHVPYPGATLDKIRDVLRPGGLIHLSVPNEAWYSLRRLVPIVAGRLGIRRFKPHIRRGFRSLDLQTVDEVHLSHFTLRTLYRILADKGFKVVESGCEFSDPFLFAGIVAQVLRYSAFGLSMALESLSGLNIYNAFYIIARRQ